MNRAAGLQFGDFTLDIGDRVLLRGGRPVALTPKAFDVLVALAGRPGRLVTKDELLSEVWPDAIVEESNLAYHVFALRKALGETDGDRFVETVPRHGYRFVVPVKSVEAAGVEVAPDLPAEGSEQDAAPPPIADPASPPRQPTAFARRTVWFAAGAATGVIAAAVLMLLYAAAPPPDSTTPDLVEISTKIRLTEASAFATSPDGQRLVFAGAGDDGVIRLWVRSRDASEERQLPGTEVELGALVPPMFWSPDSRYVAFDAAGQLKKVDVLGGAPQTICRLPALAVGGSWSPDGVVVVGQPQGGIYRCPASGGAGSVATRVDSTQQHVTHVLPSFLPDRRHFLFLAVSRTAPERTGIYLHSLDARPDASPARLLTAGFGAAYVQDGGRDEGHVLFMREGALLAQAFDPKRLRLSGEAAPIAGAGSVGSFLDGAFFSASSTGRLVYRAPAQPLRLTWLDRQGNVLPGGRVGEPDLYSGLALAPAPGETRAVVVQRPVRATLDQDLWLVDLLSGRRSKQTFDRTLEDRPVWSPDGQTVFFTATGGLGSLFELRLGSDQPPRIVLESPEHKVPDSVSPNGASLLYTRANNGSSRLDVWVLPLKGEGKPYPLIRRPLDQSHAQFSPDGNWVAYVSNESGRREVRLRRFRARVSHEAEGLGEDVDVEVSKSGGTAPRWGSSGRELFFITPTGAVASASVTAGSGSTVTVGPPTILFQAAGMAEDWGVSADGRRFLVLMPEIPTSTTSFSLIINWQAALHGVR